RTKPARYIYPLNRLRGQPQLHPQASRPIRSADTRGTRRNARVHAAHSTPDMKTLQTSHGADSPYAWTRLWVALALVTIGGAGMYSMAVVLPPLQEEFGIARADASLPFTLTMIGFGLGSVLMGRLSDRFGVIVPVLVGSVSLGVGFIAARFSQNLLQFTAIHGLLIGVGTSGTFVPLVADISLWFTRRRGIA